MSVVSSETRVVVASDAYYVANEKDIESILLAEPRLEELAKLK